MEDQELLAHTFQLAYGDDDSNQAVGVKSTSGNGSMIFEMNDGDMKHNAADFTELGNNEIWGYNYLGEKDVKKDDEGEIANVGTNYGFDSFDDK